MALSRLISATALLLLLSACASTKPKPLNPVTGLFPTDTVLDSGAVLTNKPFNPKYKRLAYVKIADGKPKELTQFYLTELRNSHLFDQVDEKSDLEALVIQKNLSDKVPTISDLVGLHKLESSIGPFLIVEPYFEWKGGYNYMGQLKAIDPETGETVLLLQQKAFNWTGLDSPLVYPLLNGFLQWARGQTIVTGPSSPREKTSGKAAN